MCSKHGAAVCIEFARSEGGEEKGGGLERWEVAVLLEATSDNKYLSKNSSLHKQVDLNSSEIKASSVGKTWPAAALLWISEGIVCVRVQVCVCVRACMLAKESQAVSPYS